jgi:hypothetical protein
MKPIRARGTLAVAGALSIAAVGPAMAQTQAPDSAPAAAPRAVTPVPVAAPAKQRTSFVVRSVRRTVTLGNRTLVQGRLRPARAGRRVQLQVRGQDGWTTVARDVTAASGAYRLRYAPERPASLRTRVAFAGDRSSRPATRSLGRVDVYRRALASWYGPGLYGGHLACGGRLSPGTLGVAHKSLPCGTRVTLRHRGRTVRVRVVDRGPYVGAREFDLTSATRQRLGFSGTGTVLTTR